MTLVSKKTSRREYLIQKKLHAIVPKFVPFPVSYKNGTMKTKKYGVSLKKWIKSQKCITNRVMFQIIRNVRLILNKIRRRYPGFRHMDLHIGNVLMYKGRTMIIDFGLSKLNAPKICPCKDMNTFIRSLRRYVKKPIIMRRRPQRIRGEESAASIAKRIALRA